MKNEKKRIELNGIKLQYILYTSFFFKCVQYSDWHVVEESSVVHLQCLHWLYCVFISHSPV